MPKKRKLNPAIFNDWIFKDIADYSHRIEVYYGGAGSGKSFGATQKILLKALKYKRKVLVIRKIQRTIKDSIWALLISHLHASGFYSACRVNRSDFEIELPNGSARYSSDKNLLSWYVVFTTLTLRGSLRTKK